MEQASGEAAGGRVTVSLSGRVQTLQFSRSHAP